MAALTGRRGTFKSPNDVALIDRSINELSSKIETVKSNNEKIVESGKELEKLTPVTLEYGSIKYDFVMDESGSMQLASDPMTVEQAQSMVNVLIKSYTNLEFSTQEIPSDDPYTPTMYGIVAKEKSRVKEALVSYKVGEKEVSKEDVLKTIEEAKSTEDLNGISVENDAALEEVLMQKAKDLGVEYVKQEEKAKPEALESQETTKKEEFSKEESSEIKETINEQVKKLGDEIQVTRALGGDDFVSGNKESSGGDVRLQSSGADQDYQGKVREFMDNNTVVFEQTKNGKTRIVAQVGYSSFGGRTGFTTASILKSDNLPSNINDILLSKAIGEWMNNPAFLQENAFGSQSIKEEGERVKSVLESKLKEITERYSLEVQEDTDQDIKSESQKPDSKIPEPGPAKVSGIDIIFPTQEQHEQREQERKNPEYVSEAASKTEQVDVAEMQSDLSKDFGLLTGENPMARTLTEQENQALNQKAEKWLREKGYSPRRVTGRYGPAENSFFVPNLSKEDAIAFAKEFNQDSVAHSSGLIYQDGQMNARVKNDDNFSFDAYSPQSDFISVVNTKDGLKTFSVGYDFSKKVPIEKTYSDKKSKPEPKPSPIRPAIENALTEDGEGNYIFHHYSYEKRGKVKPTTGEGSNLVSREEAQALSSVGGVAQYYTMSGQKEAGTGPIEHTVKVPKNKVYDFNSDPLNFYEEAKKRFEKVRPGQAFNPNYQAAWISKVANENGYDMIVANWRTGEFRAQTTVALTPEATSAQMKPREQQVFRVGDRVEVYGREVTITGMDEKFAYYKSAGATGSFRIDRDTSKVRLIERASPTEAGIIRSAQALSLSFPDVAYIVGENLQDTRQRIIDELTPKYGKEIAEKISSDFDGAAGQAVFYKGQPVAVVIDRSTANSRTAAHEVWEVILNQAFGQNLEKLAELQKAVDKQLRSSGFDMMADRLQEFSEQYDGPDQFREYMAEFGGMLTAGQIDAENLSPKDVSLINKIKDLINKFSREVLGVDIFLADATPENVVSFFANISKGIAEGSDISGMIGGTQVRNEGLSIVSRFSKDYSDVRSKTTFTYVKNSKKFEELKGKFITNNRSIFDFNGSAMVLHSPDAAFSGEISKIIDGESRSIVKGKGGIYFPINFHDLNLLWAATKTGADTLLDMLKEVSKINGGKVYLALMAAPHDKLLSSTTAANGVMEFFDSKVFGDSFGVSPAKFKKALISAANHTGIITVNGKPKEVGIRLNLKNDADIDDIKSAIRTALSVDNSIFPDRRAFSEKLIKEMSIYIKANEKSVKKFTEFFTEGIRNKHFKGVTKTGKLKISNANMVQAISEMMTEPILRGARPGDVYAVIEVDGAIEVVDSDAHESYPKAIKAENKVKLHLLNDRANWMEVFTDSVTKEFIPAKDKLKVMPSRGVATRPLSVSGLESRSQKPNKRTPSSFEAIGVKEGAELLERVVKYTNEQSKKLSYQDAVNSGVEFLQKTPEYKNLIKQEGDFITTDAMIREFKSFMGLSLRRAPSVEKLLDISKEGKSVRQEIKRRLKEQDKGARHLQRLKADMRNIIWHNIPATEYRKSEVMKLISMVNKAKTVNDLDSISKEVVDFSINKKNKLVRSRINTLLNDKYTKKEGTATVARKVSAKVKEAIDYIKTFPDYNQAYDKMNSVIDKASQEGRSLTSEEMLEVMANRVIMEMDVANGLESTNPVALSALNDSLSMLNAIINGGRYDLKAELAKKSEGYKVDKKIAYKDITGSEFDSSEQGKKDRAKGIFISEQKKKEIETKFVPNAVKKMIEGIRGYFMRQDALRGLVDVISKGPGEMFGGELQKITTDRVNESNAIFKEGMMFMDSLIKSKMQEIYGKGWAKKVVSNRRKKKTGYKLSNKSDLVLSQDEAAYLYNQYKNPDSRIAHEKKYEGEDVPKMMEYLEKKFLTPERKAFSDWMVDEFFPSVYERYNEVYRKVNGANLGWHDLYAGRLYREGDAESLVDLADSYDGIRASVTNGSMKERTSNTSPIIEMNEMDALMTYIKDMEFFHAYAENVRKIQKLFGDKDIKAAINQLPSGKDINFLIDKQLEGIIGKNMDSSGTARFVNAMTDVFVLSKLSGYNPVLFLKQASSAVAFAPEIGTENWLKYGFKSMPQAISVWNEIVENSPYVRNRYNKSIRLSIESYSDSTMSSLIPESSGSKFVDLMMFFTKAGDKAGIMGGMPNYLYYKDQYLKNNPGATKEQVIKYAISKFESSVKDTQQSSDTQDRDYFQANPNLRWLTLFQTAQKQYIRKEMSAVRQIARKVRGEESKGTLRQNIETFLYYHSVLPVFFQFIASGFPGVARDLEEEDQIALARAAILGNYNSLFAIGSLLNTISNFVEEKPWASSMPTLPLFQTASTIAKNAERLRAAKTDETKDKYKKKIQLEALSLTGLPAPQINNTYINMDKLINENEPTNIKVLRILNFSQYLIDGVTNEDAKNTPWLYEQMKMGSGKKDNVGSIDASKLKKADIDRIESINPDYAKMLRDQKKEIEDAKKSIVNTPEYKQMEAEKKRIKKELGIK